MTAIGLTSVGYTIIGLTGYVAFPRTAMSNILNNFSQDDLVVQVARALVGAMKVVSYPINHNPARRALKDVMEQATGRSWEGPLFHYGATLLFFGATLALALRVHDLGVVFKVIGGTNGAVLIFTLPGLMLIKYSYAKHLEWQRYLDAQRGDAPRESARDALLPPADADASRYASLPQPYHYLSSKLWWSGVALVAFSVAVCIVSLHNIFFPAA
ncbi:hypothetical protein H632_c683p2 [Helicosporidium sp. ATCC 50920]|nr:hypothetical protein H632_c683p2 [Helicosporidium sp. ATCC 50920]|eukprot:KDD75444.1 hypothetical protein H632_c683p2 [Helicosporidium sp. ATCC 50920]